jgi:hypothetical protein
MTTTANTRPDFAGAYEKELSALAELIEWLWTEHGKSFVEAGDDKVYAFGGNGYIVVFDQSRWNGAVELITPKSAVTIKPGTDGKVTVIGGDLDEKAVREVLTEGVQGIKSYYEKRYWSTPTPAPA